MTSALELSEHQERGDLVHCMLTNNIRKAEPRPIPVVIDGHFQLKRSHSLMIVKLF
jgi:hypothetical protein